MGSVAVKKAERQGRHLLVRVVGWLLAVRRKPVSLPPAPRILLVRLDERVGNMLLMLPLIDSLRARFPRAQIDLLASVKTQALMSEHTPINTFLPFRKKALRHHDGPFGTLFRLRRSRYDLAIDAANPTDPSATQALLVRFSGARHKVGVDFPGFGRMFSAPVTLPDPNAHEIDLRLALLLPVPGHARLHDLTLTALPALAEPSPVADWFRAHAQTRYAVLNIGARLTEKRLDANAYAMVARTLLEHALTPVLTYGPSEAALAQETVAHCKEALLAPPTTLIELGHLMHRARAVVTCDTGPMHLAVALHTPTCGIFVSTEPSRYGHPRPPHLVMDVRQGPLAEQLSMLDAWLATLEPKAAL